MTTAFTLTPGSILLEVLRVTIGASVMGGTKGGVSIAPKTDRVTQTVDQYGSSVVKSWIAGDKVVVEFGLAETTYANMAKILRGSTLRSSGGTAVGLGGLFAGSKDSDSDGVALLFHPLTKDDSDLSRDINVWRCECTDVEEIKYGPDGATVFMTTWEGEIDTTKTAGDKMIKWGLAAAT